MGKCCRNVFVTLIVDNIFIVYYYIPLVILDMTIRMVHNILSSNSFLMTIIHRIIEEGYHHLE